MDQQLQEIFPLAGLSVGVKNEQQNILLKPVYKIEDMLRLGQLREEGVVKPGQEHFVPNLLQGNGNTTQERKLSMLQHVWKNLAQLTPKNWTVSLGVWINDPDETSGELLVGVQTMRAQNFSTLRTISSGSWLGIRYQGYGVGKLARAGMLGLAFIELGAQFARTSWAIDNVASNKVSTALGYVPNGIDQMITPEGHKVDRQHAILSEERFWQYQKNYTYTFSGVDQTLPLLGAN